MHVATGDFSVPCNGSFRLGGGGGATRQQFAFKTGLKWTAAFSYSNFNQVDGVNMDCPSRCRLYSKQRRGKLPHKTRLPNFFEKEYVVLTLDCIGSQPFCS